MNIVVLVKTVAALPAAPGAGSITRQGGDAGPAAGAINPLDELAVEEALRLKERAPGTVVSALSLGGPEAENGLRRSLALGADRAIRVACDDAASWDSWATALALAEALRRLRFDLVLCGAESADRNAGLVGPYLAELLGLPHVARIAKIEAWDDRAIVVHRRIERGDRDVIECALPALLTVEKGINRPRLPAFQSVARARTEAVETIDLRALETSVVRLGRAMNQVETIRLSGPKPRRGSASQVEATRAAADRRTLMMKGGAPKANGASELLEGVSERVLRDLERVLREQGIDFATASDDPSSDEPGAARSPSLDQSRESRP